MGVELHRVPHDIGYLVESAVVQTLHRVHDATLNGLETVFYMGNGAIQNGIAGVIQEPVLVHAAQMAHSRSIETTHRVIVRVDIFHLLCLFFLNVFVIFDFFVHVEGYLLKSFLELDLSEFLEIKAFNLNQVLMTSFADELQSRLLVYF